MVLLLVVIGCLAGVFYKLAWRPRWLGPWVGLLGGKNRLCVSGLSVCRRVLGDRGYGWEGSELSGRLLLSWRAKLLGI